MAFSRLLLAAANTQKYIVGSRREDKIIVKPDAGELILCFQIDDEKKLSQILDMGANDTKCDGLIFYAKDGEPKKVICLVEMKRTNIKEVAHQITTTRDHIKHMLQQECGTHYPKLLNFITWKACFYSIGVSDSREKEHIREQLRKDGFEDVIDFGKDRNDASSFLRGHHATQKLAGKIRFKR
jgi:hypothetical protein